MDQDLIELEELLKDEDVEEDTLATVDSGEAVKMLIEECEDFEKFQKNKALVEGDLLKYFDNPKMPTAVENMKMLDTLNSDLWYGKWLRERVQMANIAATDVEEDDYLQVEDEMMSNTQKEAIKTVNEKFKAIAHFVLASITKYTFPIAQ